MWFLGPNSIAGDSDIASWVLAHNGIIASQRKSGLESEKLYGLSL